MISFHRFLIGTAIVFSAGLGIWMLATYSSTGAAGELVLGISFAIVAVALSYYLKNLRRFLGR